MQGASARTGRSHPTRLSSVEIVWLPLGAGGRSVRINGRIFEAAAAAHQHRPATDLYHSALVVHLEGVRFVVEMTPAWGGGPKVDRGVVLEGPVGLRVLGHSSLFRYEVRRWLNGVIPDLVDAIAPPYMLSQNRGSARTLLSNVPLVPALTWGRDELKTGDMWNSNSLVAWLLARSGHAMSSISPPPEGRAPGWQAGLELASRHPVPPSPHVIDGVRF